MTGQQLLKLSIKTTPKRSIVSGFLTMFPQCLKPGPLGQFLEYWEISQIKHNISVGLLILSLMKQMPIYSRRGGRARWKIENETFNTLKNQGYNFEHNYGLGVKNLSLIFAMLMMLAL
ncbi:MAG: hypothetical protein R2874_02835 [Desulfobacterales bacterium]